MKIDEIPPLMRRLRRGPIHVSDGETRVDGERDVVERVLPHRDPFLFVDKIVAFHPTEKTLVAERLVAADDPIFKGHFPTFPVFPAALQIEAIGQACLCLWAFAENEGGGTDLGLRVTKVEHAMFMAPVRPGDLMSLQTMLVYADDLVVEAAGQVWVGDNLTAILIIKVSIVDG
ncbi:MAG: hypothetical protein AAGF59_14040 [Pseudomonadota bacterium]